MAESISQKASLVAQVIEDISYEPLDYQRFSAELVGVNKTPYYKDGGYFAFTDLLPGDYLLLIFGERFQTSRLPVAIPLAPVVFNQAGDNELVVVVKTVIANNRITFDPTTILRPIRAGAEVVTAGLTTRLTTKLDAGKSASARFDSVAGIAPGAIVRIIRDRSIRLRFDPYSPAPAQVTRIVGHVFFKNKPEVPLENALIRMTEVNSVGITVANVEGAMIASVTLGDSKVVLGTESDIQTTTNARGDYNLYFSREDFADITLEASLAGFKTVTKSIAITTRARNRADIELEKTKEASHAGSQEPELWFISHPAKRQ
jgi:hypothetical protein